MDGFRRLIREIHRRSLWQVLGIYVAGSWGALQVVDVLIDTAGLPDWFPSLALALLVIGLPVVVATAFVQEGIGGREASAAASEPDHIPPDARASPAPEPGKHHAILTWRNAMIGGAAAALLWAGVAVGWFLFGRDAAVPGAAAVASAEDRRSIAVLPFETRSTAAEDSFFAAGVHDDILTQLSRIEALKVISRTSVMQYEGTRKPIRDIARELGVATVLEGGVQRAGNSVRVTAQLIDAETDEHLWADNYDEALSTENIFAIQTQVARAIAAALEARLTEAEQARIAARPTENLVAYDLYNQARYLYGRGTAGARRSALELFRRATEVDPEYAAAYAGLAQTHVWLVSFNQVPAPEGGPPARAAVERALALDPDLAEAHVARGFLLDRIDLDFDAAERAYQRALELSPGHAEAHASLARLYLNRGRLEEARVELRRAVDLDPMALGSRAGLAFVEFVSRDYASAEAQALRVLELDPANISARYYLAVVLSMQNRHADAIAAVERAVELDTASLGVRIMEGFVHARAGNRDRALAIADEVERRGGSLKEIALVHAALGDIERAFEYLERALARDPGDLSNLDIDPSADPLRNDPRYRDLLRRAGVQ